MNTVAAFSVRISVLSATLLALAVPTFGKEKEIQLKDAPEAVQATIKKTTDAGSTLEKLEIEEEAGGTEYDAKITDKNGLRWEIRIDLTGRVVKTQQKKPKK